MFPLVGGLLPLASGNKNGLLSVTGYKKLFTTMTASSKSLIQICALSETNNFILSVIGGGASALLSISTASLDYTSAKRISGALGASHFTLYKDDQGVYFKSTADGHKLAVIICDSTNGLVLQESQKDVSELVQLPFT